MYCPWGLVILGIIRMILLNILSKHTINIQKTMEKVIIRIGDYDNPIEEYGGLPSGNHTTKKNVEKHHVG